MKEEGIGLVHELGFSTGCDAVNISARLKDLAPRGTIWVGPDSYRYARDFFEFRDLEAIKVKGRSEPVAIYEVASTEMHVHRRRVGGDRDVFSPMVGREAELAALHEAVEALPKGAGA